jgi:hypothetical protein
MAFPDPKAGICKCADVAREERIKEKEVIRIGFEPMTYSLEGCRSIQLSYRTSLKSFALDATRN